MEIIFENELMLAINKPAGIVVNKAQTVQQSTVQDWLLTYLGQAAFDRASIQAQRQTWLKFIPEDFDDHFGSPEEIWQERQGIVHRLDKDTSGVLLLAKNPGVLVNLLSQFKQRQTQKTYLALCHGHFQLPTGQLNLPLGRARRNRLRFAVDPAGRPAETHYQVKQTFQHFAWSNFRSELENTLSEAAFKPVKKVLKRGPQLYQAGFSLVELQPKTGRTHQLRVHLASMQHPIVGDKVYSGRRRQVLDQLWCARHFLHAQTIQFYLPDSNKWQQRQSITAPLSPDLQKSLNLLE